MNTNGDVEINYLSRTDVRRPSLRKRSKRIEQQTNPNSSLGHIPNGSYQKVDYTDDREISNSASQNQPNYRQNCNIFVLNTLGNLPERHVAIDMSSMEDEVTFNVCHPIGFLLSFCCFLGLSPVRYTTQGQKSTFLQKVPFYIVCILLSIETILLLRKCFWFGVSITASTEIASYIDFGSAIVQVLLRLSFMTTLVLRQEYVEKILRSHATPPLREHLCYKKPHDRIWFVGAVLLSVATFVIKILYIPIYTNSGNFICNFLLSRSVETSSLVTSKNYEEYFSTMENTTVIDSTFIRVIIGCVASYTYLLSLIMDQVIGVIIFIVAVTLFKASHCLNFTTKNRSANKIILLKNYRKLKHFSQACNKFIGLIYPLHLADKLLLLAIAYNSSLSQDTEQTLKVILFLDCLVIIAVLLVSELISNKIANKREWVLEECYVSIGEKEVHLLLEEMTSLPVGIGNDSLYIDKGFIINYIGISIAYFLSVVETRAKKESEC